MLTRKCDLCNNPAEVDTKTIYGYWAYLCHACNQRYGTKAFQTKLVNLSEGGTPVKETATSTNIKIKLSGTMREIPIEPKENTYGIETQER